MQLSFFEWVSRLLKEFGPLFLQGTRNTLIISITGTIAGFIIGLLVAVVRTIPVQPHDSFLKRAVVKVCNFILTAYVEVFRSTPMMVQAMLIYYGSMQFLNWDLKPMIAGFVVISINTGAYLAEIVRGGIISVDNGQTEGAMSIGMTHWQTMTSVVLPQAIRNIMPAIGNEFIINIKDSAVLSAISVAELFFQTKTTAGVYYRTFESFFIACVIYFVINFTLTRLLLLAEKKMDGPKEYTVHGSQNMTAESRQTLNDRLRGRKL